MRGYLEAQNVCHLATVSQSLGGMLKAATNQGDAVNP